MATAPAPTPAAPAKMSFAKVAASGAKDNRASRVAVPTMEHRRAPSTNVSSVNRTVNSASVKAISPTVTMKTPIPTPTLGGKVTQQGSTQPTEDKVSQKLKDLSISSGPSTPSLVVNGSSPSAGGFQIKNENVAHISDDASQRADSASEIGTKAPSLDGKSITSGTTFALDEKESLRPDDSASVKAAADEDESFSVRGSQMANSRMGSEVARIHRLRIGDMPERRIIQLLPESHDQGIATPQSGDSGVPPPTDTSQTLGTVAGTPDAFSTMYSQNPDDKLLEAMDSPKDRIFLLRLEQDVINFVQSSKEPFMDLPPSNSFCRMLTHKLADYYHMTHSFEAVQGAVRIYRTPFCRVPPSLASIAGSKEPETATATAPPVLLPKKIMRRGEDGGSGPASTSPSKATSEVGSDGKEKDKSNGKEKLTREQREEAYNKARERIFGTSEKTGDSTPENEDANGASRASSVSGRDKSSLGKRGKTGKQRRDDSESFDSRSQYTAWYNTHHYVGPQSAGGWQPQYATTANGQFSNQVQAYSNTMQQPYAQPAQNFPHMMPQGQMNGYPQYNSIPTFPAQPAQNMQQRYPPAAASMPGYGSPILNAQPQQPWSQPGYAQSPPSGPSPYQQQQNRSTQPPTQQGIPYAFGQLPVNANPNDPKSQHPIPGSYNRHAFNPKTQSFVPGTGMGPMQSQPAMSYNVGGPHGSPQIGSPHPSYTPYASGVPHQTYMGASHGYGMSRQSSNNSLPSYHPQGTPPQHMPHHATHLPQMPPMGAQVPHQLTHPLPSKGPQPMSNTHPHFTSLPNYGNPATLPQKPPTGL